MRSLFAVLAVLCLAPQASGVNTLEQEFKCPLDGTTWKQRIETSANPRGLRSDLRQLGDIVDPPTLPQCPKCRFPLFSDQLADPVIERLKPFVLGADFQMLAPKNPSYFILAQIQEFLHAPHRYIALSYLRASWQVEDRAAVSRRHLEKAHEHFLSALSELQPGQPNVADTALLCGEVERRLGKWDEAGRRFRDLQSSGALKGSRLSPLVDLQLKLIELRDPGPRALGEPIDLQPPPASPAPDASRPE